MAVVEKDRGAGKARAAPAKAPQIDFSSWRSLALPPAPIGANGAYPPVPALERLAAGGLLVALSPLFLAIAVAIKLDSPGGPVFYRQERVGLDRRRNGDPSGGYRGGERRAATGFGQLFWIYKFRTMIPNAEKKTGPVWATESDPRTTRIGRILRTLRLDELPQLINVLRAEMRMIGPRPERPHFVRRLSEEIPEYLFRQRVPPGITGLAQVEREYDATVSDVERKIRYDLYYARNRSGLLDIKILLKTIAVALRGRGAR